MGNQGEEFAAKVDSLLRKLNEKEYNSSKAEKMWAEMIEPVTPEKKEEPPKAVSSNNEETEILKTSQGPVKVNQEYFQDITGQQAHLQQAQVCGHYYPQPQQVPQNYGYHETPPQAPQVEALMDKLNKSI